MEYLKSLARSIYGWMVKYPIAFLFALVSFVGVALSFIFKARFPSIGGALGGETKDLKNDVIPERKENGKPVPIGTSDSRGWVQVEETKEEPNLETLPVGVDEKSVAEVIQIQPEVVQVKNNDTIIDVSDILGKLKK